MALQGQGPRLQSANYHQTSFHSIRYQLRAFFLRGLMQASLVDGNWTSLRVEMAHVHFVEESHIPVSIPAAGHEAVKRAEVARGTKYKMQTWPMLRRSEYLHLPENIRFQLAPSF